EKFERAAATVVRELQVIKRLFKAAVHAGHLERSPAEPVTMPPIKNERDRVLQADELNHLNAALGKLSDSVLQRVRMAYFSGGRWGEIDRLRWQDVDCGAGCITWLDTKTGKTNHSAIHPEVHAILKSLPQSVNRAMPVFPPVVAGCVRHAEFHAKGSRCDPCRWAFRYIWRSALATAKLIDFHFHDLRHQACSDLAEQGWQQYDLQTFMRHTSPRMTSRYTHVGDERRHATAASLADTPAGRAFTGKVAKKRPARARRKPAGGRKPTHLKDLGG
ncbi:MAG: site-specific integrase, partial [Acidobacteria bacterium]|nr:site-specific integrase [Acidobacteriota bacterium]